jgi:hypothetical protein
MSPWSNTLVRRTGECFPVFLQFPNPALDHPCGTGWVLGECNCCPSGQIGCLPPAVCTLGSVGNYICAFASSSGPASCAAGRKQCGQSCIPDDADCCGTGATYCPAPKHCGARPDGSNACFDSVPAASTSATLAAQPSTSIGGGGQFSPQPSGTTPTSPTTSAAISSAAISSAESISAAGSSAASISAASSISVQSGTPTATRAAPSQVANSLGTGIERSFGAVGGAFAMLIVILF